MVSGGSGSGHKEKYEDRSVTPSFRELRTFEGRRAERAGPPVRPPDCLTTGVPSSRCPLAFAALIAVLASLWARHAAAQEPAGHKIVGTLGLDAGSQSDTGVYLLARSANYWANDLVDRNGHDLPIGLGLYAIGNEFAVEGTYLVAPIDTYVGAGIGAPISHVSISTQVPQASIDNFGLGDLAVQPIQLGWRLGAVDALAGYTFYAPTAPHEPGGNDGVGSGQWSHEPSLGGTLYFDRDHTWALSAMGSLEIFQRKLEDDVTRGPKVQVQGGFGKKLRSDLEVGAAAYGLWQLSEDKGADLPQALRGLREWAYGVGPEIELKLTPIRTRVAVRYEHDLAARARTTGQIAVVEVVFAPWVRPENP
jgi:hypothetical protein